MSSAIPKTMKAIVVKEHGGPEKLIYEESWPVPEPKDGQMLVKNKFGGVNYIDTYFRTGLYPSPGGMPTILGQEGSSTVVKVQGDNPDNFKEGERVVWMARGGYGEYAIVPTDRAIRIPEGVSDQDAVGGYLMGMTALSLVQEAYPVKKGETVLVHAAAGGVGLLLCQILKNMGATIIGTAGGEAKCKLAKEHGATHTIDYRKEGVNWVEEVKKLTDGKGVDVVYDGIGKDTWEGSLEASRRKGKVVYFGNASGPVPPLDIQKLAAKNTSTMRATLYQYIVTKEELEHYAYGALGLIKDGKLKINVHKAYDLKDAQQIHKDLQGRLTTGKLLIKY